jgi:phosphoribosylanthranilate isomerase
MTWVKICGMTNLEDALIAADAGADAVGFVFYEKSPRNVTVEQVREIVRELPEGVEKVGVFVDLEAGIIRKIAMEAGLTAVQLHGVQSLESVLGDSRPAVESVGVAKLIAMVPDEALHQGTGVAISTRVREKAFAILIDAQVQMLGFVIPVIVAGGLTASDVADAMRTLRPFGVDVVSGVEAAAGKKDPGKVRAFVSAVRDMDRKVG